MPIYLAISQKWPFENSKIAKISKITKISKLSERHEISFLKVIFIVDFEYELSIDKNFEIQPVSANSSIFGLFRIFFDYQPVRSLALDEILRFEFMCLEFSSTNFIGQFYFCIYSEGIFDHNH